MKRAALSMFLVLGAAALGGTFAVAHPNGAVTAQVAPKKQKVLIGFYKNRTVKQASPAQPKGPALLDQIPGADGTGTFPHGGMPERAVLEGWFRAYERTPGGSRPRI